jgi:hypothetical protein
VLREGGLEEKKSRGWRSSAMLPVGITWTHLPPSLSIHTVVPLITVPRASACN